MGHEKETHSALKAAFALPGGAEICEIAAIDALGDHFADEEWIKENFSNLVETIEHGAYEHYLTAQRPAAMRAFRSVFGPMLPPNPSANDLFEILENNLRALDQFFLSIAQGRKSRAGSAFEHIIKTLFDKLKYPYTPQAVINGKPDFLLPSVEHFRENAMDCIIFTVKRTLRERWRQITTEGTHGHQFFLGTIDSKKTRNDLVEMKKNRIYLVMPETIRARCYPDESNVISFENFFRHHLDPAMTRWRDNNVIE